LVARFLPSLRTPHHQCRAGAPRFCWIQVESLRGHSFHSFFLFGFAGLAPDRAVSIGHIAVSFEHETAKRSQGRLRVQTRVRT
jgi:hypothetical protein